MKALEIKEFTADEIQRKIAELGEELFKLKAQAKTGQLEKASLVRQIKKDIARCKTVLSEISE